MARNIGAIRRVDMLDRVVIPKNVCNELHIEPGDEVEVGIKDGAVVLTKYMAGCYFCGSTKEEAMNIYKGKRVCLNCVKEIKGLF